ncbi:uncharacterized protein EDB93DRAFT_1081918 [Suillus bovinus]|uniref:uncharacterized protein n=1 Tax=Suillus bovinus TaxID=48563 RepID=UPI001B870BF8|nr:uncharacterized protein EDB93DRAFT_1081918 [Suillus bovinus]KAG2153717.1 hypothetical protein EDB93DRAFT_1081918 [Suillus bovinus]
MASKKKPAKVPPVLSTSRDLVPVGPRHVQASKHGGKRDENGLKPTTSRALVLRNGKFGARGTGEVMLSSKMSGREKLDLLAGKLGNLSIHARTAVMSPLKLAKCIKIADSQFNAYLDDITNLQDPESFHRKITEELNARTPYGTTKNGIEVRSDPFYVASIIAIRIHNTYMVASAWKIVLDSLRALEKSGLDDATAHIQLQRDQGLLSRYLIVCDLVSNLVDLGQKKFSVLATTTPHYARYFKAVENTDPGEPEMAFDWAGLKDACKSFLDSIIIELCFPKQPYPKRILYHILHDAVDESPREAKRFPQTMWDAVGELSVVLELQELLDSPLLGPQGEKMKQTPRKMPEQYEQWLDAQIFSQQASNNYANFKDLVFPLSRTEDRTVLKDMWKHVNVNYQSVSNMSIDTLWQLDEALRRTPQWSAFYVPHFAGQDSDSDDGGNLSLIPVKSKGGKKGGGHKRPSKKLLAITDGRGDDESDGSMPDLQSVSDTSDDSDDDMVDSDQNFGDEDDDSDEYETESEYDSDEDEQYRNMLREAMDTAMAIPEFFDAKTEVPEFEAIAEEKKGNPFLKLLGSLRGRMFSSSAKLSSAKRSEPRKSTFTPKTTASKSKPAPALKIDLSGIPEDELPPLRPLPTPRNKRVARSLGAKPPHAAAPSAQPKDTRTTVEEVDDEDDADADTASSSKKKKKKKPKKKKTDMDLPVLPEDGPASPVTPAARVASPPSSPSKPNPVRRASLNSSASTLLNMSTTSLPLTEQTTAHSGHSFLQEMSQKEKIKSRPDHASMFSRGFLAKGKDKAKDKEENKDMVNSKHTWFSKLGKKTTGYMHQLLRAGDDERRGAMKWESFLKVMRDMGFSYDPSTAGSSVRFDPPDEGDRSITFHKPHPDPTLYPVKIKEFGKKLKDYYGWDEEDFLKRAAAAA